MGCAMDPHKMYKFVWILDVGLGKSLSPAPAILPSDEIMLIVDLTAKLS